MRLAVVMLATIITGVLFLAYAANANADNGPYIAASFGVNQYNDPNASVEITTSKYIIGANLNDFFSAELFYGSGINNGQLNGSEISLDSYYGFKTFLFLPVGQLKPYVSAGYTQMEVSVSHPDTGSNSDSASDTSLVLGLLAEINQHIDVRLEYTRVLDASDYDVTEYVATLLFKF